MGSGLDMRHLWSIDNPPYIIAKKAVPVPPKARRITTFAGSYMGQKAIRHPQALLVLSSVEGPVLSSVEGIPPPPTLKKDEGSQREEDGSKLFNEVNNVPLFLYTLAINWF